MTALALTLAALIGLSLGTLGGGGSILTVPTFVYVLGIQPKPAIAMSLLVVGATSLVGAWRHRAAGNVRTSTALLFGALSFAGSFGAARLATYVSGETQLVLLAAVMLAAAISMMRSARRSTEPGAPPAGRPARAVPPAVAVAALGVGMLTGLVGIGGGFLFVPALALLGRLPMKEAVGTSTLIIAINCAGGLVGYGGRVDVAWSPLLAFTAVAVVGVVVGSHLVSYIDQAALRRTFAVFLLAVGSWMLYDRGRTLATRRSRPPPATSISGGRAAAPAPTAGR
jgi:uncharacterized membrane protein YfcA